MNLNKDIDHLVKNELIPSILEVLQDCESVHSKYTSFKNEIYEVLMEQNIITSMFEAHAFLETSKQEKLTDVLTSIRSIKGVTIVSIVEPHVDMSAEKNKALLKIKFIPTKGIPMKNFLRGLKNEASNIPGVFSFKFKDIKRIDVKR